jgi:hypothetical protein
LRTLACVRRDGPEPRFAIGFVKENGECAMPGPCSRGSVWIPIYQHSPVLLMEVRGKMYGRRGLPHATFERVIVSRPCRLPRFELAKITGSVRTTSFISNHFRFVLRNMNWHLCFRIFYGLNHGLESGTLVPSSSGRDSDARDRGLTRGSQGPRRVPDLRAAHDWCAGNVPALRRPQSK